MFVLAHSGPGGWTSYGGSGVAANQGKKLPDGKSESISRTGVTDFTYQSLMWRNIIKGY